MSKRPENPGRCIVCGAPIKRRATRCLTHHRQWRKDQIRKYARPTAAQVRAREAEQRERQREYDATLQPRLKAEYEARRAAGLGR